jgi:hypothetical protein
MRDCPSSIIFLNTRIPAFTSPGYATEPNAFRAIVHASPGEGALLILPTNAVRTFHEPSLRFRNHDSRFAPRAAKHTSSLTIPSACPTNPKDSELEPSAMEFHAGA